MTVRCIDCKHFNLRDSHMGKHGFGLCAAKGLGPGHTFSAVWPKLCSTFAPATQKQAEARAKWKAMNHTKEADKNAT